MSVYQYVAGAGATIDNMREYLLTLYAQAYDAIDRHFMYGGEIENKSTPEEIQRVAAHFDRMIMIAHAAKDAKVERLLKKLKTATLKHMRGKMSAKQFVKVLRQIIKEYGIPMRELKIIEDRINRIEAETKRREAMAKRAQRQPNVFAALDQFSISLFGGRPRRAPRRAQPAQKNPNVFAALDQFSMSLFSGRSKRQRRIIAPARTPQNPFSALDNLFDKLTKPARRRRK